MCAHPNRSRPRGSDGETGGAGGAIGNAIDRTVYGAVFDFVHLHAGAWSWYVFNVADAAIVAGVIGLVLDSVRPAGHTDAPDASRPGP